MSRTITNKRQVNAETTVRLRYETQYVDGPRNITAADAQYVNVSPTDRCWRVSYPPAKVSRACARKTTCTVAVAAAAWVIARVARRGPLVQPTRSIVEVTPRLLNLLPPDPTSIQRRSGFTSAAVIFRLLYVRACVRSCACVILCMCVCARACARLYVKDLMGWTGFSPNRVSQTYGGMAPFDMTLVGNYRTIMFKHLKMKFFVQSD